MEACRDFRRRLEAALIGELRSAPVAWHRHLTTCGACRELFVAEEALDELLACLPDPQLPVALTQRVLLRLVQARAQAQQLDEALDAVLGSESAPPNLAARILDGLQAQTAQSEARLDAVLYRLPTPEVPAGLAARTLAAITIDAMPVDPQPVETAPAPRRARSRAVPQRQVAARTPLLRFSLAAAASVLAAFLGYRLIQPSNDTPVRKPIVQIPGQAMPGQAGPGTNQVADLVPEVPDPELLAALDLLEEWDLLMAQDLDLVLGSLDETETELLLLDTLVESEEEEG